MFCAWHGKRHSKGYHRQHAAALAHLVSLFVDWQAQAGRGQQAMLLAQVLWGAGGGWLADGGLGGCKQEIIEQAAIEATGQAAAALPAQQLPPRPLTMAQ